MHKTRGGQINVLLFLGFIETIINGEGGLRLEHKRTL